MLAVELDLTEPTDGTGALGGFDLGLAVNPTDAELLHSGRQQQTQVEIKPRDNISSSYHDVMKSHHTSCGRRTRILFKSETSKAEVNPPLFPDIFLHQTVEEEDEKSCNINKSEIRS